MSRRGRLIGLLVAAVASAGLAIPAVARTEATAPAVRSGGGPAGVPRALGAAATGAKAVDSAGGSLAVYYSPPVLVRAGQAVQIPVDVVCSTPSGAACDASLSLSTREVGGAWRTVSAPATPGLRFDLTAPAARALASGRSTGSVAFAFRAVDGAGRSATLPAGGNGTPLRFYVVPSFRTVRMPVVPFGHVSKGETVLSLPWGTGSSRAGLVLGNESPTLGPSSFDVDARGRIYLLDGLQDRLAVFSGGRLVRETRLPASSQYDVAVAGDGTAFVLSRRQDRTVAFRVDPSGSLSGTFDLGDVVPSEIRAVGGGAAVRTLPVDAWRTLGPRGLEPGLDTGRPLSDGGQLLTVARPNEVRLATLRGAVVSGVVRIGSSAALGELGLAEPDGKGGYVVVVHVWRQEPTAADQYEVVHVASGGRVTAFGAPNAAFARTAALSKFRLGADGTLYELTSSPDGMRIVRFQMGGNR